MISNSLNISYQIKHSKICNNFSYYTVLIVTIKNGILFNYLICIHFILDMFKKKLYIEIYGSGGWRDNSVVKKACCFSRIFKFDSQYHVRGTTYNTSSRDSLPSSASQGHPFQHTHTLKLSFKKEIHGNKK